MTRAALRFWGSVVAAAVGFALAAWLLLPYEMLGLRTAEDREHAWLLTVWTGGVLAVLFGITARIGGTRGVGMREVVEAGSVRAALEARRRSEAGEVARSADVWIIATGAALVGIYFAGWWVLN